MHCAILLNLVALAADAHGASATRKAFLRRANVGFTLFFAGELALKLGILGLAGHFGAAPALNAFDAAIVLAALADLLLAGSGSLVALRIVRACRLLRVARAGRLARRWPALRKVAAIALRSGRSLAPIVFVLGLFLFVFALAGMQLLGAKFRGEHVQEATALVYAEGFGEFEREAMEEVLMRFDRFVWAFVECFHVMCGEGWSARMYAAMAVTDQPAFAIYFVLLILVGQYFLINLMLAIVLDGSSQLLLDDFTQQCYRAALMRSFESQYRRALPLAPAGAGATPSARARARPRAPRAAAPSRRRRRARPARSTARITATTALTAAQGLFSGLFGGGDQRPLPHADEATIALPEFGHRRRVPLRAGRRRAPRNDDEEALARAASFRTSSITPDVYRRSAEFARTEGERHERLAGASRKGARLATRLRSTSARGGRDRRVPPSESARARRAPRYRITLAPAPSPRTTRIRRPRRRVGRGRSSRVLSSYRRYANSRPTPRLRPRRRARAPRGARAPRRASEESQLVE